MKQYPEWRSTAMSAAARANQHTTLFHDALAAYLAVSQVLRKTTASAWLQLNLSMPELKALVAIRRRDTLTVGGVAMILRVTRSEASRTADQLYRRGLITRAEDRADRRRSLLGLTRTGHDLVGALLVGDQASLAGSLACLEPADLQRLTQGLRALLASPPNSPGLPALLTVAPVGIGPGT
jgi:DNA-binding MarR family transcriptional regulator